MRAQAMIISALLMTGIVSPAALAATIGPSNPGSGYTLDFENPADQKLPDQLPDGWAREFQPALRHADGEPQIRVASATAHEPVRAGGHSVRFELDKSDPPLHNGSRAELSADNPAEPRGAERWYGFSTYLPTSWANDRAPENIAQWHQEGGDCSNGCSPPLAINTQNGHYVLSQNWQNSASVPGVWTYSDTDIGPYALGRWTDWVVHVKWSTGSDGVLQVWKDGVAVKEFDPPSGRAPVDFSNKIGRNDDFGDGVHGDYFVTGIYKWPWYPKNAASDVTNRVLYVDEIRIADQTGNRSVVSPPSGPTTPAPNLSVVDPLTIRAGSPSVPTTATFSVVNNGSAPVTVPYFLVGARSGGGAHLDLPASAPVTLSPGQRYTYSSARTLAAGSYSAWPAYFDGQTWHELGAHQSFTIPPAAPGHLAVTSPLVVRQASAGTVASFSVTNDGGSALEVPYLLVGARTSTGAHVDFPPDGPLTLQPGQSHTYTMSRRLAIGHYTAWAALYDGQNWSELTSRIQFSV